MATIDDPATERAYQDDRALARSAMFYAEESCGQCTPCRQGTPWMWKILEKIEKDKAG